MSFTRTNGNEYPYGRVFLYHVLSFKIGWLVSRIILKCTVLISQDICALPKYGQLRKCFIAQTLAIYFKVLVYLGSWPQYTHFAIFWLIRCDHRCIRPNLLTETYIWWFSAIFCCFISLEYSAGHHSHSRRPVFIISFDVSLKNGYLFGRCWCLKSSITKQLWYLKTKWPPLEN